MGVHVAWDDKSFLAGLDAAIAEYDHDGAKALDKAGDAAVEAARSKVPVDTGELRDSIRVIEKGHDDGPYVDVGTDDPVGIYQEFGTVNVPPQPFMRPALAEAGDHLEVPGG